MMVYMRPLQKAFTLFISRAGSWHDFQDAKAVTAFYAYAKNAVVRMVQSFFLRIYTMQKIGPPNKKDKFIHPDRYKHANLDDIPGFGVNFDDPPYTTHSILRF